MKKGIIDMEFQAIERIEELADGIIGSASMYQVVRELNSIGEPTNTEDMIYKTFLMSVLSALEDNSGYEH